jgi:hypothetical protein
MANWIVFHLQGGGLRTSLFSYPDLMSIEVTRLLVSAYKGSPIFLIVPLKHNN